MQNQGGNKIQIIFEIKIPGDPASFQSKNSQQIRNMDQALSPYSTHRSSSSEKDLCSSSTNVKRLERPDDHQLYQGIRKIHVTNWNRYGTEEFIQREKNIIEKMLIRIQQALDDILYFLKNQRNKKGQSFDAIRVSLLNDNIFMDLHHLKQIVHLKPDLYQFYKQLNASNKEELFISLPEEYDGTKRQNQFIELLRTFLKENRGPIPQYKLAKLIKEKYQKIGTEGDKKSQRISKIWNDENKSEKINPKDVLSIPNYFEDVLIKKVRERQERLKILEEENQKVKFCKQDLQTVFDEVYKIYQCKKVSTMFYKQVLDTLKKNLKKRDETIEFIMKALIDQLPDYFKVQDHRTGKLIAISKSMYNQTRQKLRK